ncbi:hypothetical protein Pelo_4483 [Pelomyxa schiedti]|nr:hypothetical protein Pelo_4483 [Pelomyxa schiedti]
MVDTSLLLVNELHKELSTDTLLSILVDSSGSVGPGYDAILTKKILPLIVENTDRMLRSVIEFANAARTVCPFTNDNGALMTAIKGTDEVVPHPRFPHDPTKAIKKHPGMRHQGGSSNLADALASATRSFLRNMSETSKPALIIVAAAMGEPSTPITEAYRSLMNLTPQPVIIAIGVGPGIREQQFARILPDARRFLSPDYQHLFNSLTALRPISPNYAPKLRISCSQIGSNLQTSRDPVTLKVVITPVLSDCAIPEGTILHFLPGFYNNEVVKTTAPATRDHPFETTVTLMPDQRALIYRNLVPERVHYECVMDGTRYTGYVTLLLAWFGAEWLPERTRLPNPTKTRINILLWGWFGSGKTTFCNGLATSFSSGQEVVTPLQASASSRHVTVDYTCHTLADLLPGNAPTDKMMKRLNMHFWEPWGITESNYLHLSISDFLTGRVGPDTHMNDSIHSVVACDKSQIIHSVIIIFPIGIARSQECLEVLGAHVMNILSAGRNPIVVCNFINRASGEDEVEEGIIKILGATLLPRSSVIKFDNYDEETQRNMEKDLQYWGILRLAFTNAISYLLSNPRDCYLEKTTPMLKPTGPETLSQVDVFDANYPSHGSNLWEIESNKRLTGVRKDVDETGEFTSISPWIFVDNAGAPVSGAKESELTLKQILWEGDTPSIRIQKDAKVVTVEPTLELHLYLPKSVHPAVQLQPFDEEKPMFPKNPKPGELPSFVSITCRGRTKKVAVDSQTTLQQLLMKNLPRGLNAEETAFGTADGVALLLLQ